MVAAVPANASKGNDNSVPANAFQQNPIEPLPRMGAGALFRRAVQQESPLQVIGAINDFLGYHEYEQKLDSLFAQAKQSS